MAPALDFGDRALVVVGQALDDDQRAAGTEPLVTHGLEVFASLAGGFLDRLVNHVAGDIFLLGFLNDEAQVRVGRRVGDAVLGRHVHLLAVFGIQL